MGDSQWIRENDARSISVARLKAESAIPGGCMARDVSGRKRAVTAEDVRAAEKRVEKRRAKKRGKK